MRWIVTFFLLAATWASGCRSAAQRDHLGRRIAPPAGAWPGRGTLVVYVAAADPAGQVHPRSDASVWLQQPGDSLRYWATPVEIAPPGAPKVLRGYPAGEYQLFVRRLGSPPASDWVRICPRRTDTVWVRLASDCDLDCRYVPHEARRPLATCGSRHLLPY